jgi:hypothetical protein
MAQVIARNGVSRKNVPKQEIGNEGAGVSRVLDGPVEAVQRAQEAVAVDRHNREHGVKHFRIRDELLMGVAEEVHLGAKDLAGGRGLTTAELGFRLLANQRLHHPSAQPPVPVAQARLARATPRQSGSRAKAGWELGDPL